MGDAVRDELRPGEAVTFGWLASVAFVDEGTDPQLAVGRGAAETTFDNVSLPGGPGRLEAYLKLERLPQGIPFIDIRIFFSLHNVFLHSILSSHK